MIYENMFTALIFFISRQDKVLNYAPNITAVGLSLCDTDSPTHISSHYAEMLRISMRSYILVSIMFTNITAAIEIAELSMLECIWKQNIYILRLTSQLPASRAIAIHMGRIYVQCSCVMFFSLHVVLHVERGLVNSLRCIITKPIYTLSFV